MIYGVCGMAGLTVVIVFWEEWCEGGKVGKERNKRERGWRKKDGGGDDGINDDEGEGRFGADWWGRLLRAWIAIGWGGKW